MVNVIIPVYHSRDTLTDALDSLVAQTKKLFMVVIVQDGDGEDYSDILDEYRRRGLSITFIPNEENHGPGVARQMGIDASDQAEYVMFLDSDDMLLPRAIEVLSREAKQNDLDVLASTTLREMPGAPGQLLHVNSTPVTWLHGKIYKRSYLVEKNIRFPDEFVLNEDSYFNLVAVNSTKRFGRLEECTYIWRENKNSLTRSIDEESFFRKSWILYVKSQIYGLRDIMERNELQTPLMAQTLINIYSHCEQARHYKVTDFDKIRADLRLLDNDLLREKIKTQDFWKYIYSNLRPGFVNRKGLTFYRGRFIDWLEKVKLLEAGVNGFCN